MSSLIISANKLPIQLFITVSTDNLVILQLLPRQARDIFLLSMSHTGKSTKVSTSSFVGKRPGQVSPSSSESVTKKAREVAPAPLPEKLIIREDSEEMEDEDDFELHSDFNGIFSSEVISL